MRLVATSFLVILVTLAVPSVTRAQAPDPQAEALNEEGKALFKNNDFAGAAGKFRQAIARSPHARYYFNLCVALEKLEDYEGALEACDQVYAYAPNDNLKAKTGQRAAEIRRKKRERDAAQGTAGGGTAGGTAGGGAAGGGAAGNGTAGDGTAGGGMAGGGMAGGGAAGNGTAGDGTAGGGMAGGGTAGGDASPADPYTQIEAEPDPREQYSWSIGFDFGAARNLGVGDAEIFSNGGSMFRAHADFLVAPKPKIGVSAYLGASTFDEKDAYDNQLTVVDVGAALFWHRRLAPSLYLTPLAGANFTALQPYRNADESYATFGFRFDAGLQFVLGGGHHVFSLVPSLAVYLPAATQTAGQDDPALYGFDKGGSIFTIALGYTYRFRGGFLPGVIVLE